MSMNVTPKPGSQLWGIYDTDREHAHDLDLANRFRLLRFGSL